MKNHLLVALLTCATVAAQGQVPQAAVSETVTNLLPGQEKVTLRLAPPLVAPVNSFLPENAVTNGFETGKTVELPSTLTRAILPNSSGAEANFGRHKVFFATDAAEARPVTVITPDDQKLSFRASFLVLANRTTGQSLLLGAVTNSIGQILLPDRLIWTNAFDTGPKADIEYRYSATENFLEQNIILRQSPTLPKGWQPADVVIECWTEFFGSAPVSTESQRIMVRQQTTNTTAVQSDDQTISFGCSKIVAGGKAFTLGTEDITVPVAKSWSQVQADDPNGNPRTFLIESLDYLAAKAQLDRLEKAPLSASISKSERNRKALLALLLSPQRSSLPMGLKKESSPMLVANASTLPSAGVVIDFTIISSVPLPSGAISWWPGGGNALDAITNHNNGNVSNSVAYAAGKVGQAFSFNGTSSYVKVPTAVSLNPTNGLTIEAWIYLNTHNAGDNDMILRKDGECSSRQYMLTATTSGKFRAHVGTTNGVYNYIDGTTSVTTQTWYHVAMTYSVANSNLSLYVNGALETSGSATGAITTTTQPVFIGGFPGPCSAYYFPGLIDEPSIYNRALSATEISGIYNAGAAGKYNPNCVTPSTNAVGWWPGDGNTYDLAHTNFASTNNGATYAAGVVGQAFSFDGVNDYVKITNAPDLNPTNAFTIEAWIYLNQYTYNHSIIRKDGECANRQFLLTVGPNHKFRAHVGSTNGTYYWTDGSTTVNAQTWYHVAMTFNSATSNLTLYVNGAANGTATPIGPTITTTEPIYLGGDPYPGCSQYYFGGLIDEATLYNRALSASEISAIYSAGCAGKCKIDADADGLPDDWEMRYFGNLSQSGSGDYDGDGLTNFQEYLLGTNPTQGPQFSPGAIQIHSPWD